MTRTGLSKPIGDKPALTWRLGLLLALLSLVGLHIAPAMAEFVTKSPTASIGFDAMNRVNPPDDADVYLDARLPAGAYSKRTARVTLRFNDAPFKSRGDNAWSYQVDFTVTAGTGAAAQTTVTKLAINRTAETETFESVAVLDSIQSDDVRVEVISTKISSGNLPTTDIELQLVLSGTRDEPFDGHLAPTIDVPPGTTRIVLTSTPRGAQSYEFEWVYTDAYDAGGGEPRDAVRVQSEHPYFDLDLAYPTGQVQVRARALGRPAMEPANAPGPWSSWIPIAIQAVCAAPVRCMVAADPGINWDFRNAYSQSSNGVSSMTYFDGSFRMRQSQQLVRSYSERLINETAYDREGRGRVQFLPAPLAGLQFQYATRFNVADIPAGGVVPYDHDVFDGLASPPAQSTTSGAGRYYSPANNNPLDTYVADAEGYAFAATEAARDASDRTRRAGSRGATLALGAAHDTRFRYGTAASSALHRLFGLNVGQAAFYERVLQLNQNGQAHVSYVDRAGRSIATALAGDAPGNLDSIKPASSEWLTYRLDENNTMDVVAGLSRSRSKVLTTETSNLFFRYALDGVEYSVAGVKAFPPVCESCRYRLTIRILDEQGLPVPLCEGVSRQASANPDQPTCSCGAPASEVSREVGNQSPEPGFCDINGDQVKLTPTTLNSPVEFCATLPEGEYEVIKELVARQDVIDSDIASTVNSPDFETTNSVVQDGTITESSCGESCETFCRAATNTPKSVACSGDPQSDNVCDQCVKTCSTGAWTLHAASQQRCDALQAEIDRDLAPRGVLAGQASHPEQCQVKVCRDRNPTSATSSDEFDMRMMSVQRYDEALCQGFLDPLGGSPGAPVRPANCTSSSGHDPVFDAGAFGASVRPLMHDAFQRYSDNVPGFDVRLSTLVPPILGVNIWTLAQHPRLFADTNNPNGRTPTPDEVWKMFRALYFNAKHTRLAQYIKAPLPDGANCPYWKSTYAHVKEPFSFAGLDDAAQELRSLKAAECGRYCPIRVREWMDTLTESCDALNFAFSGERTTQDLEDYCSEACTLRGPPVSLTPVAVGSDSHVLSAAANLPPDCSLAPIATDDPMQYQQMCRSPAIWDSSPPPAPSEVQAMCHDVPTTFDPAFLTPRGSTPKDQREVCDRAISDLVQIQTTRSIQIAATNFDRHFRERYHGQCVGSALRESFSYDVQPNEYHFTLQYYDQAGDLVQTVPPKGIRPLSDVEVKQVEEAMGRGTPPSPNHTLLSRYQYNSLGQVVAKSLPDSGTTRFWYNRVGQLRLSQSAQQQADQQYSYLKYDPRGRIVESGVVTGLPDISVAIQELTLIRPTPPPTQQEAQDRLTADLESLFRDPEFPIGIYTTSEVVKTLYDHDDSLAPYCKDFDAQYLRGRVAAVIAAKTSIGDVVTCYSYDVHGNISSYMQRVPGLGDKRIDYDYDILDGRILATHYQPQQRDALHHRYQYDDDRRLITVETSRDGELWERDAAYSYYRYGPLARVEFGADLVQGVDYLYSINGWPKGINSDSLDAARNPGHEGQAGSPNAAVARDAFGSSVHYFADDYKPIGIPPHSTSLAPQLALARGSAATRVLSALALGCLINAVPGQCNQYNGNPAATVQSVKAFPDPTLGWAHRYDQVGRLKASRSFVGADASMNIWPTLPNTIGPWSSHYDYDANGNITQVERLAKNPAGGAGPGIPMDSLLYTYAADSNRLLHINDDVDANAFPDDLDDQGPEPPTFANYAYDLNGRLIRDNAAGIFVIRWDSASRVRTIDRTNDTLEFVYDGLGQRIAKIQRVGLDASKWKYEYFIRDEKSNILASYKQTPSLIPTVPLRPVLIDQTVNGITRLGLWSPTHAPYEVTSFGSPRPATILSPFPSMSLTRSARVRGAKQYELTNYLGNVYVTVRDRKLENKDSVSQQVVSYDADVVTFNDFESYGSLLAGRREGFNLYRHGFSGLERDDELKGGGNSYYTNARLFDPRVGRWLSPDAVATADLNAYAGFSNLPVRLSDPEGTSDHDAISVDQGDSSGAGTNPHDGPTIGPDPNPVPVTRGGCGDLFTCFLAPIIDWGSSHFYPLDPKKRMLLAISKDPNDFVKKDHIDAFINLATLGLAPLVRVGLGTLSEGSAVKGGTEAFYRTMSQANYDTLLATGKIPATSETFVSPSLQYASEYSGVTVQFNVQAGTADALKVIGVRNAGLNSGAYGNLPLVQRGWGSSNAFFKLEGNVVNIGLGRGSALDTFNNNIVNFTSVPKP